MASILKTKAGRFRVQIESNGKREYKTFSNKTLALSPQCADPELTSISVRGRPPVLAKQSVVSVQLSTGTGGQFEAGVNNCISIESYL